MSKLKELTKKRDAAVSEIRRLRDLANKDDHDWTSGDDEAWTRANAEFDQLTRQIDTEVRTSEVEAALAGDLNDRGDFADGEHRSSAGDGHGDDGDGSTRRERHGGLPTPEQRALALQAWALRGVEKPLRDEHIAACRACGINPSGQYFELDMSRGSYRRIRSRLIQDEIRGGPEYEQRAPQTTSAGTGGELIPEGFVYNWERAMLAFGNVRAAATVVRTDSGNALPWPTTNDTANEGEQIDENTAVAEQNVATGAVVFGAYKYSSKLILVPQELLEDSAFDLEDQIGSIAGERIARITNKKFTIGTGTDEPNGIVTASTLGKTTAANNAITADEILDLIYSVDESYRGLGRFMMKGSTELAIRKLKDSTGQYLWQPSVQAGKPATLFGFPTSVNEQMAAIGTTAKVILFGQLAKYVVRDVRSIRLRRLVERYAEKDQVGFVAFSRHDGDLLDAGTNPVKHLAMAA